MIRPNYYEILGIRPEADTKTVEDAISSRIKEKQLLAHSLDRNVWQKAEEELKLLLEARKVLLDPARRREYDLSIKKDESDKIGDFSNAGTTNMQKQITPQIEAKIIAKCHGKHTVFFIILEKKSDGKWLFKRAYIPAGYNEKNMIKDDAKDVTNFDLSKFKCPVCGNTALVKCGKCYHVACGDKNMALFSCPWCETSGVPSGRCNSVKGSNYEAR